MTTERGTEQSVPCDTIIIGSDLQANKSLLDEISVAEKYAIGDCNEPYNIALAIRSGNDVGRAV